MRKGMSKYEIKRILEEKIESDPDLKYYLDNVYTIMVKFETVPEYIVKAIDDYMERTYSKA